VGQINITWRDNLVRSEKFNVRGHKGDDVFSYAQLLSFHRRATPARCSRIPSLFDCATTRLCAMENWNIQERCRFKRERDANNSDIPGPIGSRPGGHDGRLGNRPRKLKRQTRWRRSDRTDNLSCHKEIGYIDRLESLFRVLPVDIREFYLQPVALCLSLRPHPATPSRHLFLSRLCLRRAPLTGSTCKCIQYFKISSPLCHVRNRTTPSNCDSVQEKVSLPCSQRIWRRVCLSDSRLVFSGWDVYVN